MRAAIMRGGEIVVDDIDEPEPGPGRVLIAPHATGICGTDLHFRETSRNLAELDTGAAPVAFVPGHELAGEVVALGPDTDTDLRVGDLVTAIPFTHGPSGIEIIGFSPGRGGGLAELMAADAARTFRLPPGVGARLGALAEPVAVAVHAFNQGAAQGPLVVVGAGPIGLGIIAMAVVADRHPLVVVEPSPERRAAALALGADAVHEPGTPLSDLLADLGYQAPAISPLLDGEPVTATVFECVGRPEAVASIVDEAPRHSRVVLAGVCQEPVRLSPIGMTLAEVTIVTSFAYRPDEFRAAMGHLQRHPERFAGLITSVRSLDETAAAYDALADNPREIKVLIDPTGMIEGT